MYHKIIPEPLTEILSKNLQEGQCNKRAHTDRCITVQVEESEK